jgi:hypothetical protein
MIELPGIDGPLFVPADSLVSVATHVYYGSHVYLNVSPGWVPVKLPPAEVVRRFQEAKKDA